MHYNKYNDYDEAKKMLNVLRNLKHRNEIQNSIHEQTDMDTEDTENVKQDKNNVAVINDVEVNINTSNEEDFELDNETKNTLSQMIDNFKSQVTQIVNFEPGFTINDNQIRLDGNLTDFDLGFVFIVGEENGLYLNADMLELDSEILIVLDKLNKFNDTFKTGMESVLDKRNNNI